MAGPSLRKAYYAGVIIFWLVMMTLFIYRHYDRTAESPLPVRLPEGLTERFAVPFNLRLPGNTSYLKVRITGIDPSLFELNGGRQMLRGPILTIFKDPPEKKTGEDPHALPEEFLGESFSIKSRDPVTVALAREISGNETEPVKVARLIYEWVYRNIRKEPAVTLPVSTDVLRTRRGDCNEHATLFTALARAAGVPSRVALGLVYADGRLYYHAWSEILAGGWIAVDPTLGQFPADASHIRLVTGDLDKQTRIISVIGRIKLEGLEYRTLSGTPTSQNIFK